jgi:hypothetical protein
VCVCVCTQDNFLRKYNSVLLDKEAIQKEQCRLQQENGDLRFIFIFIFLIVFRSFFFHQSI